MGGNAMTTLDEFANIVRSKNAGPFRLTFDIFFDSTEEYRRGVESNLTDPEFISNAYDISEDQVVGIYDVDKVNAIKITIERSIESGNPKDTDIYGAQQHLPLLSCEI